MSYSWCRFLARWRTAFKKNLGRTPFSLKVLGNEGIFFIRAGRFLTVFILQIEKRANWTWNVCCGCCHPTDVSTDTLGNYRAFTLIGAFYKLVCCLPAGTAIEWLLHSVLNFLCFEMRLCRSVLGIGVYWKLLCCHPRLWREDQHSYWASTPGVICKVLWSSVHF